MTVSYSVLFTNGRTRRLLHEPCYIQLGQPRLYLSLLTNGELVQIARDIGKKPDNIYGYPPGTDREKQLLIGCLSKSPHLLKKHPIIQRYTPQEVILDVKGSCGLTINTTPFIRQLEFILQKFPFILNPTVKSALSSGVRISANIPSTNLMNPLSLIREGWEHPSQSREFCNYVDAGLKPELALLFSRILTPSLPVRRPTGQIQFEQGFIFRQGHHAIPPKVPLKSVKTFIQNGKAPVDIRSKVYSEVLRYEIDSYWYHIGHHKVKAKVPTINDLLKTIHADGKRDCSEPSVIQTFLEAQEELLK